MSLPDPDHHHFLAAEGWLELGNIQECYNELEEISPMYKTHRSVLELRVKMYAKAEKWDHVEPIAGVVNSQNGSEHATCKMRSNERKIRLEF